MNHRILPIKKDNNNNKQKHPVLPIKTTMNEQGHTIDPKALSFKASIEQPPPVQMS